MRNRTRILEIGSQTLRKECRGAYGKWCRLRASNIFDKNLILKFNYYKKIPFGPNFDSISLTEFLMVVHREPILFSFIAAYASRSVLGSGGIMDFLGRVMLFEVTNGPKPSTS